MNSRVTVYATINYRDRKSTRLNSSHSQISYAVFCLKKKNSNRAMKFSFVEGCSGLKRRAAFGTFKTPVRWSVIIESVAVMPGFSLIYGLLTQVTEW